MERVVTEFNKELQSAFKHYSLDDIERLATQLLTSSVSDEPVKSTA